MRFWPWGERAGGGGLGAVRGTWRRHVRAPGWQGERPGEAGLGKTTGGVRLGWAQGNFGDSEI